MPKFGFMLIEHLKPAVFSAHNNYETAEIARAEGQKIALPDQKVIVVEDRSDECREYMMRGLKRKYA